MFLSEPNLTVPHKIRRLLNVYRIGALFLNARKFRFLRKEWGFGSNAMAIALLDCNMIVVDDQRITEKGHSQEEINYILLHEIAHVGENHLGEQEAHDCALKMAEEHNIKIDFTDIALD
jgi:hypothetical protein